MTVEEIKAKHQPRQLENQVEFDAIMSDINQQQGELNTSDLRRITKGGPQPTHKIDGVAALIDALYCFDLSEGRIESN